MALFFFSAFVYTGGVDPALTSWTGLSLRSPPTRDARLLYGSKSTRWDPHSAYFQRGGEKKDAGIFGEP